MENAHGDIVGLSDAQSNVIKTYTYDAFGVEQNIDPNDTNPFRYCGEYYDELTKNTYLRARYYRPSAGRFFQEDPAKDGLNWYVYANNNPVMFTDNSGLSATGINFGPNEGADWMRTGSGKTFEEYWGVGPYGVPIDNSTSNDAISSSCGSIHVSNPETGYTYSNSITDNGNGVYTANATVDTWLGSVDVTYKIDNGVIRFTFADNNYWGVLWRGGGRILAEGMLTAARSINSNYLSGRTIGGINVELQLHYYLSPFISNAKTADIGGTSSPGYDSNAWFFETANAANILNKIINGSIVDKIEAIQDIGGYLFN